jgi:uncharacterized protein
MNRKEFILAGLAPANFSLHSPVQIQKLFFLIDRNISKDLGGTFFDFKPYHYGPFDKAVYETLEELAKDGLVEIVLSNNWKEYRLTETGQGIGERLLKDLPERARNYIVKISEFVRKLTFTQLVSSIYRAYPEMREKSVFQG